MEGADGAGFARTWTAFNSTPFAGAGRRVGRSPTAKRTRSNHGNGAFGVGQTTGLQWSFIAPVRGQGALARLGVVHDGLGVVESRAFKGRNARRIVQRL